MNGSDVGMVEAGEDLGLPLEPGPACESVSDQRSTDHLWSSGFEGSAVIRRCHAVVTRVVEGLLIC